MTVAPKEPIPLTSPNGTVYAYACGQCRHVGGTGTMICAYTDEEVHTMAESSREEAERCCVCRGCGGLVGDRWSRFFGAASHHCETCAPAEEERVRIQSEKLLADMKANGAKLDASLCPMCGHPEDA